MPKHFPSWRTQVPILLIICLLAVVARRVLDGYQDQYQPVPPDKPFVAAPRAFLTLDLPTEIPNPVRPPPAASALGLLLSLMAEDPTIVRRRTGMLMPFGPSRSCCNDVRGNAVCTKIMRMPPMIEVPDVPRTTGNNYDHLGVTPRNGQNCTLRVAVPEAYSTRTGIHRTRNLTPQEVTSSGGYRGQPLERFHRTRNGGTFRSQRTPRSAQTRQLLPVASRLRPIRKPSCARPIPWR
jgi:hypothetical protein